MIDQTDNSHSRSVFPRADFVRPRRLHRSFVAVSSIVASLILWIAPFATYAQAPAQPSPDAREVTVKFTPVGYARTIAIAGTFNQWNRSANMLTPHTDGAAWTAVLTLEPGAYPFKYVIDGTRWVNDPARPRQDDGSGNINSLLIVEPPGYEQAARVGDGHITDSAVRHNPAGADIIRLDRAHLELTLRTRRDDVAKCWVLGAATSPAGRTPPPLFPMQKLRSDVLFDYWRGDLPAPPAGRARYAFLLRDGDTAEVYDSGRLLHSRAAETRWFVADLSAFPAIDVPDWAHDAVFYQIFPDRFADGNPANNGVDTIPWGGPASSSKYMGGDLAGITQHADYLKALGINALYLNPIFAARSSHGYDTTDYHLINPRFGTARDLTNLTAKAHSLGWHVLLDGVFNHTGVDFDGFKSLQSQGEKSPFRNWYFVSGFPIQVQDGQRNYAGWYGSPWMPKLNVGNPETKRFLLDVGTRWITDAHIDGWRLDAADEVDHAFWKAFRTAVRRADPDAFLVGEIWGNAADWLRGDEFDSAMNYRWRGAALEFFATDKLSPAQFDSNLARIREDYHPAVTGVMFNMLDSHDTERLRNSCRGQWPRERQAVLFQMTYPGVPCIYYGDEVGLEGGRDPDNRRAFEWDRTRWDNQTFAFYRRILDLRKTHSALRRGVYRTLTADNSTGLFAFERQLGGEKLISIFNRSDMPRSLTLSSVNVPASATELLKAGAKIERRGPATVITLPERGVALIGS